MTKRPAGGIISVQDLSGRHERVRFRKRVLGLIELGRRGDFMDAADVNPLRAADQNKKTISGWTLIIESGFESATDRFWRQLADGFFMQLNYPIRQGSFVPAPPAMDGANSPTCHPRSTSLMPDIHAVAAARRPGFQNAGGISLHVDRETGS